MNFDLCSQMRSYDSTMYKKKRKKLLWFFIIRTLFIPTFIHIVKIKFDLFACDFLLCGMLRDTVLYTLFVILRLHIHASLIFFLSNRCNEPFVCCKQATSYREYHFDELPYQITWRCTSIYSIRYAHRYSSSFNNENTNSMPVKLQKKRQKKIALILFFSLFKVD